MSESTFPTDYQDLARRALLAWYVDAGADETIGDAPVDRFATTPRTSHVSAASAEAESSAYRAPDLVAEIQQDLATAVPAIPTPPLQSRSAAADRPEIQPTASMTSYVPHSRLSTAAR